MISLTLRVITFCSSCTLKSHHMHNGRTYIFPNCRFLYSTLTLRAIRDMDYSKLLTRGYKTKFEYGIIGFEHLMYELTENFSVYFAERYKTNSLKKFLIRYSICGTDFPSLLFAKKTGIPH